jgi:S-disulfanyl-L-cysteine oxidoreductase SoxD
MSMAPKFLFCTALILASFNSIAETVFQPLGNAADNLSKQAQWNLSISPTGEGLPAGKGTAAQGSKIFALQCAGCHGPKGIGASADPLMGEVGSLASDYPEKTVNSYWPYATTLFDYIRRAMPINAPFSLTADEVYALSAYILSQDGIIAADIELNQENLPQVSMPNRDGFIAIYPD